MAYGDFAMFMPDEGQYRQPWAFDTALRAEAMKRASYLSSMDQFYEQLGESRRQFDLGHTLETRKVDISEAFGKAQLELEEKLGMRKLDVEEKLGSRELGLKAQGLQDARSQYSQSMDFLNDWLRSEGSKPTTTPASVYTAPLDKNYKSMQDYRNYLASASVGAVNNPSRSDVVIPDVYPPDKLYRSVLPDSTKYFRSVGSPTIYGDDSLFWEE